MLRHIPIEDTFSEFVCKFGGERVSALFGPSPKHPNADYLFRSESVIAELKCLEEDKREDAALQSKVQALFDKWMSDGRIPLRLGGTWRVESRSLPEDCQRALLEVYKTPIQRRVLKANKQIKATAERLRMPAYRGLLLLANDGNYALEANAVLYLVWRALGNSFRNIANVVYFTVNMPATSPFIKDKATLVWAEAGRKNVQGIAPRFLRALRDGWFRHLEAVTGEPFDAIQLHDLNELEQVKYDTRI